MGWFSKDKPLRRSVRRAANAIVRSLPFKVAGNGRRSDGVFAGMTGPNGVLVGNIDRIRNITRDTVRQNGLAARMIELEVSAAVGAGIRPITRDPKLRKLWKSFVKNSDPSGGTTFYGQQASVYRSMLEGGDAFGRIRTRLPEDGLPVPLQVGLYEAEQLPTWKDNGGNGNNRVIGGVEFDLIGRPVAYHFLREHPGERRFGSMNSNMETVRVPADVVLHVRDVISGRVGTVRTLPRLTTALIKLRDLDTYDDAELVRKKTASFIQGFIKTPADGNDAEFFGDEPDEDGVTIDKPEPGEFTVLPPGFTVDISAPTEVGGTYDAFMRWQIRLFCATQGIAYHSLTGDFSGLNDRTVRAINIEIRRRITMVQRHILIHQFCQPVWEKFIDTVVMAGLWDGDADEAKHVEWAPHGWEYLQPVQEMEAAEKARRIGVKSRRQIVAEMGGDVEEVDAEIAADAEREERMGIVLDSNPAADSGEPRPGFGREPEEVDEEDLVDA